MDKTARILFICLSVALAAGVGYYWHTRNAEPESHLVILHANDTHSHFEPVRDDEYPGMGGIIERAAYLDSVRVEAEHRGYDITFINENPDEIAEIETEYLGLDLDTVKGYLAQPDSQFFPETRGAGVMADFMLRAGFIDDGITMEQFLFDGVNGD